MNIILDTNVLVSSLFNRGAARACLLVISEHPEAFNLCYSSQIMDEYEDVLSRSIVRLRGVGNQAEKLLAFIRTHGEEVIPKYIPALVYPDIKDKPFLEAAVYVDGILITNNLRDFPFLGVHVVAPADFVAWWQTRCMEENREF